MINDMRSMHDFRAKSFSNFKMTEVRKEFVAALHAGKLEPACYWGAEMICSGHLGDIWELLLLYMSRYVHLANPKLPIYLDMRYRVFCNIAAPVSNSLELRNHDKIRKLFAEVVCSVALSNKRPSFEPMKINPTTEFDMTRLSERLKAPSLTFAVLKPKDPKEMFIAMNEFAYHLSVRDMSRACYWIEWGIEFEQLCKARKEPCTCAARSDLSVEKKFSRDVIWLFWDILVLQAASEPLLEKVMQSLLRLFCIKYTTAACKRRRHVLYHAVGLVTDPWNRTTDLVTDRSMLETAVLQIDSVYAQIKKNEVSPKQEYLYHNLSSPHQATTERALQQLAMVNQLDIFGERLLEQRI